MRRPFGGKYRLTAGDSRLSAPGRPSFGWAPRGLSLALSVVLAADLLVVVTGTGQALAAAPSASSAPTGAAEAKDENSARVMARLRGHRVEVLDARTDSTTTWINPDGSTSEDMSSGPVRFQDGSGRWQAIDTTLHKQADGAVRAKAHPLGLTMAGQTPATAVAKFKVSGAQAARPNAPAVPLVSLAAGDSSMTLSWRGALAAPSVQGSTVRYANALTSTDLVIESTRTGFEQFLELKDRSAVAANSTVVLTLKAKGLTARANVDSSVSFLDPATGTESAVLPAPVMWDSQVDARTGDHKRTAPVGLEVGQNGDDVDLTLTPDAAFLADPATRYPVIVDPAVNIGVGFDTFVQQGYATDVSAQTELKLGNNGSGQVARSFLQFAMSKIAGKRINTAKLNLFNFHSWSCTAKGWEVWDTGSANTGTRWTAQPNWNKKWASSTGTKGHSAPCGDGWVNADITTLAQAWADNGKTVNTLGIRAADEGDSFGWKKFNSGNASANTPYLSVTYSSTPAKPTSASVTPSAVNSYNGNRYVTSLTPQLAAVVSDPDGGTVKAQFEVTPDPAHNDAGTFSYTGTTAAVASGGTAKLTVPTANAFPAGAHLRYRARANDGALYGAWTGYAVFTLNTAKPAAPGVTCDNYPKDAWAPPAAAGAKCTFDTAATDGQGYLWGLDNPNTPNRIDDTTDGSGGDPLTVTIKPGDGLHTLHVKTVDSGGNLSTSATTYGFGVGAGGVALLAPGDGERPARRTSLAATGKASYTGVTYQYRRSETENWTDIPVGHVRRASDGAAVSAWPFAVTGGTPAVLSWNITDTLPADGPVDVRAAFTDGTITGHTQTNTVTVDRDASSAPVETMGPGTLNLLTGDFTLSATDASAFSMSVSRSAASRSPGAQEDGQAPIFGEEWTSGTIAGPSEAAWSSVKKTSATSVVLVDVTGGEIGFTAVAGGWKPEPGAEELTLAGSFDGSFVLKDSAGNVTDFTKADSALPTWRMSASRQDGLTEPTTTVVPDVVTVAGKKLYRPKMVVAPTSAVSIATCSAVPATAGCRVLEFVYAPATTGTDSAFGDYTGQVKELRLWSTEPGAKTATSKSISGYRYDAAGRLREQYNPLREQSSTTKFSYDAAGRVTQLTPGSELPWAFAYGKVGDSAANGDGMLLSVSRSALKPGTADVVEGTATSNVVYEVPLSGPAAPYQLGGADVKAWGQTDAPTSATAIFPPDAVPAGHLGSALAAGAYGRAPITYTNASGRQVNSATPGGYLTTTEYDRYGNVVRALSAANRAVALGVKAEDRAVQLDLGINDLAAVERAELLSARTVYDPTGIRALEVFGPVRQIALTQDLKSGNGTVVPAGTLVVARNRTVSEYDQGRPTDGTATVEDQVTRTSSGAQLLDFPAVLAEAKVTETVYDWVKGLPITEVEDPAGEALTTTTDYDSQGRAVKEQQPGGTGSAASTAVTSYWSATGTGACSGRPEWADLPCSTGPAGPITGGGANPAGLPVVTSEYDWWGQETKVTETANGVTRTNTTSYDKAGRPFSVQTASGVGQPLPEATTEYDQATGRPLKTVSPTGGTISRGYDKLGRMISYGDADGGSTRAEYDVLNRLVKQTDSVPSTVTYSYDHSVEPRGLAVKATDSVAGTFAVTFDADGDVAQEKLPGGYTLDQRRDPAGAVVSRAYTRDSDGAVVMADAVTRAVQGEITSHSGWSTQEFGYDRLGRLTTVEDTVGDTCTRRSYTFDKRSNRTSLTTAEAADCATGGGTTTNHGYDSADRLVDEGYTYDAFGRTTALPGSAIGYFANDLVRQQTSNGQRQTWQLDANLRTRSWSVESQVDGTWTQTGGKVNHYAGDNDSPRWIVEDTGTGELTRMVDSASGEFGATTDAKGATVLQMVDIHGDVALQLPLDPDDAPLALDNDEYGNPRSGQPATRYDWLGGKQRSSETLTGLSLMGARLYNPVTGRFLSVDPVPDGGANDYAYCSGDPVNCTDTTGLLDYSFKFFLGNGTSSAHELFRYWMDYFGKIFPLKGRAQQVRRVGQKMDLRDSVAGISINFNVRVASIGSRALKLATRKGSVVHGRNSYILFTISKSRPDRVGLGKMYLTTHGHTSGDSWMDDCIDSWKCPISEWMYKKGARGTWEKLASNLRRHV